MKRIILPPLFLALLFSLANAQNVTQTTFSFGKSAVVNLSTINNDFYPVIRNLEAPAPGTESSRAYLELLKSQMPEKKYGENTNLANKKASPYTPFILRNFKGNAYKGIPNDNSMAISNSGTIVSCINSTLQVYSSDGDLLSSASLAAIGQELNLPGNKFDPRVIYDPKADRFIMTYLNGSNAAQSNLTIGFSETSDPSGNWNLYALPGNPLVDSSWSDYPMISITENEVFYTINLLRPGGSWQTSFKQTVIWQIDKNDGYSGNTLTTKLWSDIKFGNKPIRNLHPVKGGKEIYGPNMYFLSDRNFDLENDTIFFLEITGEQKESATELKINYLISDTKYGVPPNAAQKKTILELQTNDARILDAFLEKDQIVFASNCIDTSNNFAAIFFGHITNVSDNPSIKAQIYTNDSLEFGYPGLAFTGNDSEFSAVLCMNYSSFNHFPGCGVAYYDGNAFSNFKRVKTGQANINILGGAERWGDYIGMQPKYNELGICWMAGTYGKESQGVGTEYGTWIAEIQKYGFNTTNKVEPKPNATLYPNPASSQEWITVEFQLENTQNLNYQIYSTNGKLVSDLLNSAKTSKGKNEFVFDASTLKSGFYILQIGGSDDIILSKKFQVY